MDQPLSGRRVLVVEDELLVAMLLEDIVADLGAVLVGPATRIPKALEICEDASVGIDVAILDVNVGGSSVFPVADALTRRGVPFVFATGYGQGGLPDAWRDHPTLPKPFNQGQVEKALVQALQAGADSAGALRQSSDG